MTVITTNPKRAIAHWITREGEEFNMLITVWLSDDESELGRKIENLLRTSEIDHKYWPQDRDSIEIISWKRWTKGDWI